MEPSHPAALAESLVNHVRQFESAAIALSGGVDSAVVAAACFQALGNRAVAITGIGAAVSSSEQSDARNVANAIGIAHIELATSEIEDPNYIKNDGKRCFYCKSSLYATLSQYARSHDLAHVVSGTNHDDLGDYRPGLEAGAIFHVRTPLADLRLGKSQVRSLAEYFNLPIYDKPASPCLASRIAYGQQVTPNRLSQIEQAESFLLGLGFRDVRVRLHADDLARIELHRPDLLRALEPDCQSKITERLNALGFKFITMDLNGRQSGSLNRALPVLQ